MIVNESPFKETGNLKRGFRVVNGVVEMQNTTPVGVKYTKAMKNKKDAWTLQDCDNQFKRLMYHNNYGTDELAQDLGITESYLKQMMYGYMNVSKSVQKKMDVMEYGRK